VREVILSSNSEDGHLEWIKNEGDVDEAIDAMLVRLIDEIEMFQNYGSGFRWEGSISLGVKAMKKTRGIARSKKAGHFVKTPLWIIEKHAVLNMKPPKEHDEKCFAFVLLRGKYPLSSNGGKQGSSASDLVCKLNEVILPEGVTYPIPIHTKVFKSIEELNPWCSFSVFHLGRKKGMIRQIYLSDFRHSRGLHLQIGVLTDPTDASKSHFVLIRKMGALLEKKRGGNSREICERCLTFHRPELILEHERVCWSHQPTRIIMPKEKSKDHLIQFRQWQYRLPAPFVIYADFECLLHKPTVEKEKSGTSLIVHQHEPFGFAYVIHCLYPHHRNIISPFLNKPLHTTRTFIGSSAVAVFLTWLWEEVKFLREIVIQHAKAYIPQAGDQERFHQATHCHICFHAFKKDEERVLDHDHFTGLYRGAAHRACNSHYTSWKERYQVPIIFHNLRGYDSYIIIRGVKDILPKEAVIEPIAKSIEKYISFTITIKDRETKRGKLSMRFIDSLQFMQGSLEQHVENLKKAFSSEEDIISAFQPVYHGLPSVLFPSIIDPPPLTREQFQMAISKGIFPYEYMVDMERLKETQLPAIEHFSSKLSGRELKEEEYQQAQKAWSLFNCSSLEDYTRVYVGLDVLLLASVFERFRGACLDKELGYGLDPVHFLTAPSLSWSAMLFRNHQEGIVIENMLDYNMLLMVEKGIRGGMCQVFHPMINANFKGM
jgi:hypothetical protein